MATATLPLRLLASKTLPFPSAPSLPASRCSLPVAASAPRRCWRLLASAEEPAPAPVEAEAEAEAVEEEEVEEEEAALPEPVEAQIAAAGAGKDADIFAVVMVGLACPCRQYFRFSPARLTANKQKKNHICSCYITSNSLNNIITQAFGASCVASCGEVSI